jgi:hypothetical protein
MSVLEIPLLVQIGATFRESFLTNSLPRTCFGTPAGTSGEYRTRHGTPFPSAKNGDGSDVLTLFPPVYEVMMRHFAAR